MKNINYLFFYLFMPSDIFSFPGIWLAAAAEGFLLYLNRGPKVLFLKQICLQSAIFLLHTEMGNEVITHFRP